MDRTWFGLDGFPCVFAESSTGSALIRAIAELPGGEHLGEKGIEGNAHLLLNAYQQGRDENLPRNQPATRKMTDDEIRAFHDMAIKLADHIEGLHRPAVAAMFAEGGNPFNLVPQLREAAEIARFAFGMAEVSLKSPGRPKKSDAIYVTEMASFVFNHVSGRRPTFTTHPATGEVSGSWPDFLGKVFAALQIDASVASQVRAISEKTPAGEG